MCPFMSLLFSALWWPVHFIAQPWQPGLADETCDPVSSSLFSLTTLYSKFYIFGGKKFNWYCYQLVTKKL